MLGRLAVTGAESYASNIKRGVRQHVPTFLGTQLKKPQTVQNALRETIHYLALFSRAHNMS